MKITDSPAYRAVYTMPGYHFPALAFAKLVRLGGSARGSKFTALERGRMLRRLSSFVRHEGDTFQVTAEGWKVVNAEAQQMVLDGAEGIL